MKIIHTSDLHIGKVLYGEELTENHQAFFGQLLQLVKNEQPDALLVAGDIYETSNPSVASKRLFNENMLRIHEALPSMSIVIISGNHDSAQRVGVDSSLWELANVRIVTSIAEQENDEVDYDAHIVELKNSDGKTCGFVGAVPFAYEQSFPKTSGGENRVTAFYRGLLHRMSERNSEHLPLLLMGHLTVAGNLDFSGHKLDSIGGVEAVSVADFSDEFDYFALGHIHHPQFVCDANEKVRYSGTPIAVSFDEPFDHSVSVVTFDEQNQPQVREHKIEVPHRLITVPAEPTDFTAALNALKAFPLDGSEYVRLNVKQETAPSDALAKATDCLSNIDSKLLTINYVRTDGGRDSKSVTNVTLSEFRELTPLEVARRALGDQFTEEMEQTFKEVLKMLND